MGKIYIPPKDIVINYKNIYNVLRVCLMHCRYLEIMTANDIHDKPWQCIVSDRVTTFLQTLNNFFFFLFLKFLLDSSCLTKVCYFVLCRVNRLSVNMHPHFFFFLPHLGHPKALNALCYIVCPHELSLLDRVVYICQSQPPNSSCARADF